MMIEIFLKVKNMKIEIFSYLFLKREENLKQNLIEVFSRVFHLYYISYIYFIYMFRMFLKNVSFNVLQKFKLGNFTQNRNFFLQKFKYNFFLCKCRSIKLYQKN